MSAFHRLPLPSLKVFEAAGRGGSFARAAQELNLSPSAVSHAIRKLEALAGQRLFTRSTRSIALTAEGRLLLEHVQRGLEEMQRGFSAITSQPGAPLRLHAAPAFATQWLMPRLGDFVRKHPEISLRLSSDTNYAMFENDDFDLDIVYGEPRASGCEKTPLLIEELTPLCSPALAEKINAPQDLYALALIHSDVKTVQWNGWFSANNLAIPVGHGLSFDRTSMAIAAAIDGLGVAMESTFLTQRERADGRLVAPLLGKSNSVRYVGHHLVHPHRKLQHTASQQFRQWLMHELARAQ